jgi:hypothetical protein
MNAEDEELFLQLFRTIELCITRIWVLQQILDHHQIPNWREDSLVVEVDIAPDVRRKVQPLFDVMMGKPAQVPLSNPAEEWQVEVRRLIDSALDPGPKP